MLDNEPEGGERTGATPADETATDAAPAQQPPPRRRSRRAVTADTTGSDAPVEASPQAAAVSGEAPDPEVIVPIAGDPDAPAKTPRRRRKATTADKTGETLDLPAGAGQALTTASGPPAGEEATGEPAMAAPSADVGPDQPVKVTRTRRRRATVAGADAAPAAQPATGAAIPPAGTGQAVEVGDGQAVEALATGTTPPGRVDAQVTPAGQVGAPDRPAGPPADPTAGTQTDEPTERTGTRRRRSALTAPTLLFVAPEAEPEAVRPAPAATEPAEPAQPTATEPTESGRRRRRGRRSNQPEPEEIEAEPEPEEEAPAALEDSDDDDDDDTAAGRRRRRRGRRGRGRGRGSADDVEDDADETAEAPADAEAEADADEAAETDEPEELTRRRRRRRRKGAADGADSDGGDDGVPTVVKIREPRRTVDEVQGVSGSTRLEAKRQRRRDGREQRRTRPPILSESEFLARREAVDRVMVVRQHDDRIQIGVLEDGVLVEHYVSRNATTAMAGNVYLGKVQNVLPSMEAAFVDVGRGRNAVLYAGEVNWDTSGLEGRARSIEQALRSGDSVLVQVTKDPIGHKGARLTSHIALSGRHLVYVPNGNASGISRKLPDTERKRLRDVLKKLVPEGAGVIVRTAAEGASEDELARDVKRLQAQWEDIQAKAAQGGAPVLLYQEPDLVIRVVRDLFNEDFRELVVQGDQAYEMVESYLSHVSPDLVHRLHRHTGTADVFVERRIDEQILKGLDRKVFLPSGGHLVIDRTEAMTVVDVNTGKYTGAGGNLEETVTRNNLEAAEEIVRQLRLRDLGGIVVIDFIDMVLESNRELVLRRLTECLGRDRTKHQVTEITSLGLVQMTRKRIGAGLLEAFSETCECCKGRGLIVHTEPVPEKGRNGGAERPKVAAPAPAASADTGGGSARRRGRRSAVAERTVVEVSDDEDTMGYDLSRYESVQPAEEEDAVNGRATEPMRLTGADDPDALAGDGDADADQDNGTRRHRRSARRRSRTA